MNRGAWQTTVHGVAQSETTERPSTHLQFARTSQVARVVENLPAKAGDPREVGSSLGRADPLEQEVATHSRILAWKIPWTEEPGGLQSKGSQRVGHD